MCSFEILCNDPTLVTKLHEDAQGGIPVGLPNIVEGIIEVEPNPSSLFDLFVCIHNFIYLEWNFFLFLFIFVLPFSFPRTFAHGVGNPPTTDEALLVKKKDSRELPFRSREVVFLYSPLCMALNRPSFI
jgi:hypothetical protein